MHHKPAAIYTSTCYFKTIVKKLRGATCLGLECVCVCVRGGEWGSWWNGNTSAGPLAHAAANYLS